MNNNKLLKSGYKLSLVSLFMCLFAAIILLYPVYVVSVLVFSITKDSGKESAEAILLTVGLIIFTLLKVGFSITGLVFGFKIRRNLKLNPNNFEKFKLILLLAIINIILIIITILALCLGLLIKYLIFIDIAICLLLLSSAIILLVDYSRRKKINLNQANTNSEIN